MNSLVGSRFLNDQQGDLGAERGSINYFPSKMEKIILMQSAVEGSTLFEDEEIILAVGFGEGVAGYLLEAGGFYFGAED